MMISWDLGTRVRFVEVMLKWTCTHLDGLEMGAPKAPSGQQRGANGIREQIFNAVASDDRSFVVR